MHGSKPVRKRRESVEHAREHHVDTARTPHRGHRPLPHERDEAPDEMEELDAQQLRKPIRQASRDLAEGLVDTERRGIPSDVPTPGKHGRANGR